MSTNNLSFHVFHIGDRDPIVREHLNSLRTSYPSANIVYLTDVSSELPDTDVFDSVSRRDFSSSSIMYTRLAAYAAEPVSGPTFFLDTDMLVNRVLPEKLLDNLKGRTALCRRQYNNNAPFNPFFRGIDFSRFQGKSLGAVFPYLACCTYSESTEIWISCLQIMHGLDPCFYQWYGDQECLKILQEKQSRSTLPYLELPETRFAALPSHDETAREAYFVHYKGQYKEQLRRLIHS